MNTLYNNTFLNSLFTSDEFNFIKHLDSNNEEFSKLLENEKKIRDVIVNLIVVKFVKKLIIIKHQKIFVFVSKKKENLNGFMIILPVMFKKMLLLMFLSIF